MLQTILLKYNIMEKFGRVLGEVSDHCACFRTRNWPFLEEEGGRGACHSLEQGLHSELFFA